MALKCFSLWIFTLVVLGLLSALLTFTSYIFIKINFFLDKVVSRTKRAFIAGKIELSSKKLFNFEIKFKIYLFTEISVLVFFAIIANHTTASSIRKSTSTFLNRLYDTSCISTSAA